MNETIFDLKRKILRRRVGDPKGPWEKFYEYIVADASTTLPNKPNWEARALFAMIQVAFDGSGTNNPVPVSPYLVHNMAACTKVALNHDQHDINWNDYDDVLKRTYTGFAFTVIHAVKNSTTIEREGQMYLGGLRIPQWFVVWVRTGAVT